MNTEEFEEIVKASRRANPFWFESEIENESVTLTDLLDFEKDYQVSLPEKYKSYILKYGAGYFAFTNVYSPATESEFSIGKNKTEYLLPSMFFPISDNGCGDYYGFIVQNGMCSSSIYWLDHEEGYKNPIEKYKCLYEFLIKVGLNK